MFGSSFVPWDFINEDLGLWTYWKDERSFNNLVIWPHLNFFQVLEFDDYSPWVTIDKPNKDWRVLIISSIA